MSSITNLINYNFGGIRRKDSVFSSDKITCSDCQNVELFFTELNSGVGIRTTSGNTSVCNILPADEKIIAFFESTQLGNKYLFLYTESETQGKLYSFNIKANTLKEILNGLTTTGKASGVDFAQGWLDMFIFSNGEEVKYIYSNTETGETLLVESTENIKLVDVENRTVKGLGLVVFDGRLWMFNDKVLWYSQKGDCRIFNYVDTDAKTSSGYIEFVKNITAIYPYLGSLAVFHKDSSVLIKQDETTLFKQDEESPGGCASYNSLVFHGTDLYFYDDTKKGVFSFQQIVNGDKTLGENIALDIQDELMKIQPTDIDSIRALSVVTSDRNEVWFLIPISDDENYSYVMIFDYVRGEWVKRKCQHINTIGIFDSTLYSAGDKLYQEYTGEDFDGEFIECYFKCTVFNLGSDNTLKITKFPPRITVDGSHINDFYVKYVKNYDLLKQPKVKHIKTKTIKNVLYYDTDQTWDNEYIYIPNALMQILKMPSATFKALEITIYTQDAGQGFYIKTLEMSKVKVKQI